MNVRRFTARTSREALRQVREALGEDAVVLSTKPAGAGVEVLAMAPEGMRQVEELASTTLPQVRQADDEPAAQTDRRAGRVAPVDEHALVPGLRSHPHAQAPQGVAARARPIRPSPAAPGARRERRRRRSDRAAGRALGLAGRDLCRRRGVARAGQGGARSPPRSVAPPKAACSASAWPRVPPRRVPRRADARSPPIRSARPMRPATPPTCSPSCAR